MELLDRINVSTGVENEMERGRGVSWDPRAGKWRVRVRGVYLGVFENIEDANAHAEKMRDLAKIPEWNTRGVEYQIGAIEAARNKK